MQTQKQSFIEAITNTAVGFGISLAATFVVFPLVGVATTPFKNVLITIFFTVISILRGYIVRRWFNSKDKTAKPDKRVRLENGKLFWLHCFECENDMPVVEDKEEIYCSNCGLIHK